MCGAVVPSKDNFLAYATKVAFESGYIDPNRVMERFIASMVECRQKWRQRTLYAPYFAVVQASMMGKSRLFFTLAEKHIFVFYICIGGDDFKGYPRSNPALVAALTSTTCTEGFYAAFLLASLEALIDFRRSNPQASGTEWIRRQDDADTFWVSILGIVILHYNFFIFLPVIML